MDVCKLDQRQVPLFVEIKPSRFFLNWKYATISPTIAKIDHCDIPNERRYSPWLHVDSVIDLAHLLEKVNEDNV